MGRAIGFAAAILVLMLLLYCMAPEPATTSLSVPNDEVESGEVQQTATESDDSLTTE